MPDKPKLTLETALAEFPDECDEIIAGGAHYKDWEPHMPMPWHWGDVKLDSRGVEEVAWRALQWLAGKPATLVTREGLWADDPLRMLLEEVSDIMANEKEG